MTAQPPADGADQPWEAMLRQLLGPAAEDAIRELRERGIDPQALMSSSGMPTDPASMAAAFRQFSAMMAAGGDESVNWPVAHDLARQTAAQGGDPTVSPAEQRAVVEALLGNVAWNRNNPVDPFCGLEDARY